MRAHARGEIIAFLRSERFADRAAVKARVITALAVTGQERAEAFQALFGMLEEETRTDRVRLYARTLASLAANYEDRSRILEVTFGLLAREDDPERATELAATASLLGLTMQGRATVRERLLALLAAQQLLHAEVQRLIDAVCALGSAASEQAQLSGALLGQLEETTVLEKAVTLTRAIHSLRLAPDDRARGHRRLIALLALAEARDIVRIQAAVAAIRESDPANDELVSLRRALLTLLENSDFPCELLEMLAQLDPTQRDGDSARALVLTLLGRTDSWLAAHLVRALAPFGLTERDKSAICLALTRVLVEGRDLEDRGRDALLELEPTAQDRAQIIEMLIAGLRADIKALPPAPGYPAPENPHWGPRLAP